MEIKTLSSYFYDQYKNCPEILSKLDRPYSIIFMEFDKIMYAIPIRTKILHNYALFTPNPDKNKFKSGLDFTKSIPILNSEFIGNSTIITENEFRFIKNNKKEIYNGLKKFVTAYRKEMRRKNKDSKYTSYILKYSSLQYFHKELGI